MRENRPRDDPRWAPFNRLSARMVDYASVDECLAFLHERDNDVLTDDTIAWLGTGLLDFLVEEYGPDCETELSAGVANANFRAMLECVSSLWDDTAEMLDRVLDREHEPRESPPRVDLQFAVTGNELDPDAVTRQLGLTPTHSWRRGDSRTGHVPGTFRSGVWVRETKATNDINDALAALLELLRPLARVLDQFRAAGLKTWVSATWWVYDPRTEDKYNGTPDPVLVQELATLGLDLTVDVQRRGSDPL